jgi:hypothetical protein
MHLHRTLTDVWSGLLRQKGVDNPLIGLEAKRQDILL